MDLLLAIFVFSCRGPAKCQKRQNYAGISRFYSAISDAFSDIGVSSKNQIGALGICRLSADLPLC
jgi:hypothetical protein